MTKVDRLQSLYDEYRDRFCENEVVPGEGNADSRLLLVGEAPGRDEVRLSKPFVGAAGKNLNEFLKILDIDRNEIYITNAIKYRLSRINSSTGRVSNRPASKAEIEESRLYLIKEIDIIGPEYIITLGNVPLKAVTGSSNLNIGEVHGELKKVMISGKDYMLFSLYHPASIIYNQSLRDVYAEDIKKLKNVLCSSQK